ncbi:MAG: hypothetical protein ACOZQL_33620 [Myxococcota bacterium]
MWLFDLLDFFKFLRKHGDATISPLGVLLALLLCVPAVLIKCGEAGAFERGSSRATVTAARPDPRFDVEVHSRDGNAVLFQTRASGRCLLDCRVGSSIRWSAEAACLGEVDGQYYLSDDCERLLVERAGRLSRFRRAVRQPSPELDALGPLGPLRYAPAGEAVTATVDGGTVELPL